MGARGQGNVLLRVAALCFCLPATVMAEENLGWHGMKDEYGASLFYGIPQSDHAPLSFSCAPGSSELAFAFAFAPVDAVDGAEVEVLLEAGGIGVPVAATGARIEMDDSFVLEGRTVLDARLADLLASGGTLSLSVGEGSEEFPLDGAREAAAALIETCSGKASDASSSEAASCDLAAWIAGNAPADLALRAGPGPGYPALATVPGAYSDGEETYFPEVRITGSRDGWFRISAIVTDLYGGLPTDPVTAFAGEGWLPGNVLRLRVESGRLWSRPSDDAPIASVFDADGFETDVLHACAGSWAEVEGRQADERLRGWTADICASQVTTCP